MNSIMLTVCAHSSNSNTVMYREVVEFENLTNSDVEAMAAVYGE